MESKFRERAAVGFEETPEGIRVRSSAARNGCGESSLCAPSLMAQAHVLRDNLRSSACEWSTCRGRVEATVEPQGPCNLRKKS